MTDDEFLENLDDEFFQTQFPKLAKQLGIVYTPEEVVDFILHSVDDVLKKEFGRGLTDEGVRIIDPFTGTGKFISRLFESGLIKPEDLVRKYMDEIRAYEIVPIACKAAAHNIKKSFYDQHPVGIPDDVEFPCIRLVDTFQMYEDGEPDFKGP